MSFLDHSKGKKFRPDVIPGLLQMSAAPASAPRRVAAQAIVSENVPQRGGAGMRASFQTRTAAGDYPLPQPPAGTGFDRISRELRAAWRDVVADMTFRVGDRLFELETAPRPDEGCRGPLILIEGRLGGEHFTAAVESGIAAALLQSCDEQLRRFPDGDVESALVAHVMLAGLVERIERGSGMQIEFDRVRTAAELPVRSWLHLALRGAGLHSWVAIAVGAQTALAIGRFAAANRHPGERAIAPRLSVRVGPVALATEQVHRARAGAAIDCGVDPSAEVRGVLQRSDGAFWPVVIDDEAVTIAGPMRPPLNPAAGPGTTYVTIRIGDVSIAMHQRIALQAGDRLAIARIAENMAEIHVGNRALAHGHLDLVEDSLVVQVSGAGGLA
jgi:hypothetical protein